MIYYFSGTGNSKRVAEQLAAITDDAAVDIMNSPTISSLEDQTIGIVFPIYAWGPPEIVLEFSRKLVDKPSFTFAVCTCGEDAGNAMKKLNQIITLDSMYSISMPNNYVIGSELESDEEILCKITKAKDRIKSIGSKIINKQRGTDVNKGKLSWLKSNLINYGFNKFARSTKPFYATDKCTSCQMCVKNCPAKTISLVNGKPQWDSRCFQCTACINICPEHAIQYGKGTLNRKRYHINKWINS